MPSCEDELGVKYELMCALAALTARERVVFHHVRVGDRTAEEAAAYELHDEDRAEPAFEHDA